MFEQISKDPYIIDLYRKVEAYEDLNDGWSYHNLNHVNNVAKTVESVLSSLGYSQDFINEAKIAALLHDVGCINGKENHAYRSYEIIKEYFESQNISLLNKELVLDAIKMHSDGFDTNNIIALAVIFADKLDIKYDRLAKSGYSIIGLKELQYIKDIIVNIDNNKLIVKFIADSKINIQELEKFYFISKVFKAIKGFARLMNLDYIITLNNVNWNPNFSLT